MGNNKKPINQKMPSEMNKAVWILRDENGKFIDSCRQKSVAQKEKRVLEKSFYIKVNLERDNSLRNTTRSNLKR